MHKVSHEQIAFTLEAIERFTDNQDITTFSKSHPLEEDSFFAVRGNDRSVVSFTITSVLHVSTEAIIGHPAESYKPSTCDLTEHAVGVSNELHQLLLGSLKAGERVVDKIEALLLSGRPLLQGESVDAEDTSGPLNGMERRRSLAEDIAALEQTQPTKGQSD